MERCRWTPHRPGLQFLLPDGVPYAKERGLTIVIRGRPGTGKTVVAADLAVNCFWHRGGRIALFDLEQGAGQTEPMVNAWLGRRETEALKGVPRLKYDEKQVLDKNTLEESIQCVAGSWGEAGESPDLILVDSINAVSDGPFGRGQLDEGIRAHVVQKGIWLLLVCESGLGSEHDHPWLAYLADLTILLEREQGTPYSKRTLEVEKCRNAYHVRGAHLFAINRLPEEKGVGVSIYPSLAAKLSKWRDEYRETTRSAVSLGMTGLDDMVGDDGVPRYSSTAYVGTRACRKTPCALHFALPDSDGREKDAVEERTLIVSLGVDEAALAATASDYDALATKLLKSRTTLAFRQDLVEFHYVPAGYISPEKLVQQLEDKLSRGRLTKVIVTDLCQIPERFPLLQADHMFLAALVQLFRAKKVTSLFADTVPRTAAEHGLLESRTATLVDNVIEFRHLFFYGQDHVGVAVRRRHGARRADRQGTGFRELKVTLTKDGLRKAEAEQNLDGFTALFSDSPRFSPISLFLFETNRAQAGFNGRIEELVKSAFPGLDAEDLRVTVMRPDNAQFHLSGLKFATGAPQPDVRVAMLDEYWVKEMGGLLSTIPDSMHKMRERLKNHYVPNLAVDDENCCPHYLNVGVLAGLSESARSVAEEFENWRDFESKVEKIQLADDKQAGAFFDFDKRSPESWSCMLLEILSCAKAVPQEAGAPQGLCLSGKDTTEELAAFVRVFWGARARDNRDARLAHVREMYHNATVKFEENLLPKDGPRPLFFRAWYSDLASHIGHDDGSPGVECLLPVVGGHGVSGEWYWGVVASTRSEIAGWQLVELLSSDEMTARKFGSGVGLPAEKHYYDPAGGYVSIDPTRHLAWVKTNIWDKRITRNKLKSYPRVSPILRRFLYEVLALNPAAANLKEQIASLSKTFDTRLESVYEESDAGVSG